jgi:hypothetical protein
MTMYYHAVATLPGDRRKSIVNKSEQQMLYDVVLPFVSSGIIKAKWGAKTQSYQVLDLRVYRTPRSWDKRSGTTLEEHTSEAANYFSRLKKRAEAVLGKKTHRVFIVMPIQGEKYGSQEEQRIYAEYDKRFEVLEEALSKYQCVAIRIDKEHPLDDLVRRIKEEIRLAKFVIADLTDERPSCYFEVGFAEALRRPTIYVASKQSVTKPGTATKIHFDIHMNVSFFTNHQELSQKVRSAIDKNREKLFAEDEKAAPVIAAEPG